MKDHRPCKFCHHALLGAWYWSNEGGFCNREHCSLWEKYGALERTRSKEIDVNYIIRAVTKGMDKKFKELFDKYTLVPKAPVAPIPPVTTKIWPTGEIPEPYGYVRVYNNGETKFHKTLKEAQGFFNDSKCYLMAVYS